MTLGWSSSEGSESDVSALIELTTSCNSPGGVPPAFDSLSLSSTYVTPRTSTTSLPSLADYTWEASPPGAVRKSGGAEQVYGKAESELSSIERTAVSAIRGTAVNPPGIGMDVDTD